MYLTRIYNGTMVLLKNGDLNIKETSSYDNSNIIIDLLP